MRKVGVLAAVGLLMFGLGGVLAQDCEPWVDPCPPVLDTFCYTCDIGGWFGGFELVPWSNNTVMPVFAVGWEGRPEGRFRASFLTTFLFDNPVVLDGWYGLNISVLVFWPRTNLIRLGVGCEAWWFYRAGFLPNYDFSINATVEGLVGAGRIYAKAHLPVPVDTTKPYLGVTLSLGTRFVVPDLFGTR